mgnify:CR=1 FL=1
MILGSYYDWLREPFQKTLIMGIVNVTPDSFSDGGMYYQDKTASSHAIKLLENGADIIDVGGESTRPGAVEVSEKEEISRVLPVIKQIRNISPDTLISIDTTKSNVARCAIEAGANIINDISGLTKDPAMVEIGAEFQVPIVIMHMQGNPVNMQNKPYYKDIIFDISKFFSDQIKLALDAGISRKNIILDPGIGFGKSVDHNFQLIKHLKKFCDFGFPVLIGPSRKSFIGIVLDLPVNDRFEGTSSVITAGILNGARIVRVHNVEKIKRVVTIADKIRSSI